MIRWVGKLFRLYRKVFDARHLDMDCDGIADGISVVDRNIREVLAVGMYRQAVTMYLQLLALKAKHFIEDEHWCYFDDVYSPEYVLQTIYEDIMKYDIEGGTLKMLEEGHKEILASECY